METSIYGNLHLLKPPFMETFIYGNLHLWKPPFMETSIYGNLHLWKPPFMETSIYGNLHLWKPPFMETFIYGNLHIYYIYKIYIPINPCFVERSFSPRRGGEVHSTLRLHFDQRLHLASENLQSSTSVRH